MSPIRTSMKGLLPVSRRSLMLGAAGAAAATFVPRSAGAVTEVNFVEAVHNLGYIDLYVEQAAGYFEKQGIHLNVSAAGGDTQAFAAVLGRSALFGIGDPTMVPISVEGGGPGRVVGTVVQRAHYFGVSKDTPRSPIPSSSRASRSLPRPSRTPTTA